MIAFDLENPQLTFIPEATVHTPVGKWKGEVGLGHDWVVVRKAKVFEAGTWFGSEPQIFPRENVDRIEPSP